MKINREKSKKMIKVASTLILAGMLSIGNNVALATSFEGYFESPQDSYLENHFDMQKRKVDYLRALENADVSCFDSDFVKLYREGKILVSEREKEYDVSDLYIINGKQNDSDKIFLVSYEEGNVDIVTGDVINDFVREGIMLFKNSSCFYQIYQLCSDVGIASNGVIDISKVDKSEISSIISEFDGMMHDNVPETMYVNKIKKR